MTKPTLYYFAVRGRAELIRLILAETGVDYHEHLVAKDTPPQNGKPTDFTALKASGLLPLGAVPVWEEPDGFRLAQSMAIVRYLAKSHGLMGKTPREEALVDQMLGAFDDVRPELRKLMLTAPADLPKVRAELQEGFLPRWLDLLDKQLAMNRDGMGYLVGESFTVADLSLWYLLELCKDNRFGPLIEKHPRLVKYAERIAQRPKLAAWITSHRRPAFIPPPG